MDIFLHTNKGIDSWYLFLGRYYTPRKSSFLLTRNGIFVHLLKWQVSLHNFNFIDLVCNYCGRKELC